MRLVLMYFNDSDLLCLQSIDVRLLVRLVGKLTLYVLVYKPYVSNWSNLCLWRLVKVSHRWVWKGVAPRPQHTLVTSFFSYKKQLGSTHHFFRTRNNLVILPNCFNTFLCVCERICLTEFSKMFHFDTQCHQ